LTTTDHILWELGEFQIQLIKSGAPWKENCYLVYHRPSSEQMIIDPGGEAETIIQAVLNNDLNLRYLWLTHAHHDHVGAVAALCRRFGLACNLHKNDIRLLRHAPMYAIRFAGKIIEPPQPFQPFEVPIQFSFGGQAIRIIYSPGHTTGSVCFYMEGFVFTGDTLLYKHVGRTDLPGSDTELLKTSISQLIETLPGKTMIFPGHGRTWTVEEARAWWKMVTNDPPIYNTFEAV
jgi:hydroxyacylglutathione hydrolase